MLATVRMLLGFVVGLCVTLSIAPLEASPKQSDASARNPDHVAPWDAVTFTPKGMVVHVGGRWYHLVSLEGVETKHLIAASQQLYKTAWKDGLRARIVPVLRRLGKAPRKWVSMQGIHIPSKKLTRLRGVALTRFNYDAVKRRANAAAAPTKQRAPAVNEQPGTPVKEPPEVVPPRADNQPSTKSVPNGAKPVAQPLPSDPTDVPTSSPTKPTPSLNSADEPGLVAETPPHRVPEAGQSAPDHAPGKAKDSESASGHAPRAPWEAVYFPPGTREIHVKLGDSWSRLLKLNNVKALHLVMTAQNHFGAAWQENIATNLDGLLETMNRRPGNSVRLELSPLDTTAGAGVDTRTVSMNTDRGAHTASAWHTHGNKAPAIAPSEASPPESESSTVATDTMTTNTTTKQRAPWDAVVWDTQKDGSDRMRVRISDSWFHADRIDGVKLVNIIAEAKSRHGTAWKTAVEERLDELVATLGTPLGASVTVDVRAFSSGSPYSLDVPHTAENVARVVAARNSAPRTDNPNSSPPESEPSNKVEPSPRGSTTEQPARLGSESPTPNTASRAPAAPVNQGNQDDHPSLDDVLPTSAPSAKKQDTLSSKHLKQDIQALVDLIESNYVGHAQQAQQAKALLMEFSDRIPADGMTKSELAERIHRHLVTSLHDGVSHVVDIERELSAAGDIDVRFLRVGNDVAGLMGRDETPLGPTTTPLIHAIDGVPVSKWLSACNALALGATDAARMYRSAGLLRHIGALRKRVVPSTTENRVTISLRSADGLERSEVKLPLQSGSSLRFGANAVRGARLSGDIGHLRIATMTQDARDRDDLERWLTRLKDARGLILDLRDTTGTGLAFVDLVMARVAEKNESWIPIVSLAVRHSSGQSATPLATTLRASGYLPVGDASMAPSDRKALAALVDPVATESSLGEQARSARFAYVYRANAKTKPNRFNKPIVVLINAGTQGAAEALVAALSKRPNVTVLGEVTAGSFALTTRHRLPHSGIKVDLAASIVVDGQGVPFVGKGRVPDVEAPASWKDALDEATDSQLSAARALIVK